MKTLKPSERVIMFKQAFEMIKTTKKLTSSLPVPINSEVDAYFIYQNSRELTSSLAKYEKQKAEIVEIFRRTFL